MNRKIDFNQLFDVFGTVFEDFKKYMEEEHTNEDKSKQEEDTYHVKYDKYVDGEHVAHVEKEYKDGKCIKNEGFNKCLDDKKTEEEVKDNNSCQCECKNTNTNDKLSKENSELLKENKLLRNRVDYLERKLDEVIGERDKAKDTLKNIKKMVGIE